MSELLRSVRAVLEPQSVPVANVLGRPRILLSPCNTTYAPEDRADSQPPRGGPRMQFGFWTSRARGLLADALAYSQHVMALVSERTHLEALPVPDEPLLSWSVYLTGTPAKWLGNG